MLSHEAVQSIGCLVHFFLCCYVVNVSIFYNSTFFFVNQSYRTNALTIFKLLKIQYRQITILPRTVNWINIWMLFHFCFVHQKAFKFAFKHITVTGGNAKVHSNIHFIQVLNKCSKCNIYFRCTSRWLGILKSSTWQFLLRSSKLLILYMDMQSMCGQNAVEKMFDNSAPEPLIHISSFTY